MARPIALLTGGNSGIGFECARALAASGWQVLMASRNRQVSERAARRIAAESGADSVEALGLDLGSFESVRAFASEIDKRELELRALVCNAGLQFQYGPKLSSDGFEMTFAVNHLGHFLLANLLLRRLAAHAPARIVVVSSGVHEPGRAPGMPDPAIGDLESLAARGGPGDRPFEGRLAYVNSKLCNLWFAYELARRIDAKRLSTAERPLPVIAYEPGLVPGSGLARDYPAPLKFVWDYAGPPLAALLSTFVATINPASKSGAALARMVTDPELANATGKYFPSHSRWREAPSSEASYDLSQARALWDASVRMARLSAAESPLVTSS
jgi:light-dependent protochlorophyllide reductase